MAGIYEKNENGFCWRIIESSHGGVDAEYGMAHNGGVTIGSNPGVTMPGFVVYYSAHFDSKKQAEIHIKKNPDPFKHKKAGF